jgi:KUP system potassium uptake protein
MGRKRMRTRRGTRKGGVVGLIIGSMGVVYGDIGTSPLYALRESSPTA